LAEQRLREAGAVQFAAASAYRRGQLLGGADGDALVRAADAELRALGATNPRRVVERLVPGLFARPRDLHTSI
jgi:hypothetical protein